MSKDRLTPAASERAAASVGYIPYAWRAISDSHAIGDPPELSERDYARFNRLLLNRCGMHFSKARQMELALGVSQAFAASTCATLDDYYRLLLDPKAGAMEMDRLINAVTISETHFFRNSPQFDALYTHVLPEIIERRRPARTLRIWSAGCASGEEPYSIAILLRELLPDVDDWTITILGTDINTEALDRARSASYGAWAFREHRAKLLRHRYFRPQDKRYELLPEVRRMVTFTYLNLAEDEYPSYGNNTAMLDLILCRNVTIYFSQEVTKRVIGHFYDALVEGGWLVVGHSEPSLTLYRDFQVCNYANAIFYRRNGALPTAVPGASHAAHTEYDVFHNGKMARDVERVPEQRGLVPVDEGVVLKNNGKDNFLERAKQYLEYGHSELARDVLLGLVTAAHFTRETDTSNIGLQLESTDRSKIENHSGMETYVPIYALLGQAYANLGCWSEAEDWCRLALSLDKLSLSAYYTLALVLQHQGKLDEAIEMMRKVIYLDHTYILGHFGLANLYYATGQLSPALKSLENARRLLNNYADVDVVADSGGITVARLREAIVQQQQRWRAQLL